MYPKFKKIMMNEYIYSELKPQQDGKCPKCDTPLLDKKTELYIV
jgi:hypothetical protein